MRHWARAGQNTEEREKFDKALEAPADPRVVTEQERNAEMALFMQSAKVTPQRRGG